MKNLNIKSTSLEGLKLLTRSPISDERGFFARLFCSDELKLANWTKPISQINLSYTKKKGTVRGMHYQNPPYAEMKVISCIKGSIWDVAIDLRSSSPTFMKWESFELSESNGQALFIPPGYAHGFQSLTDDAELIYFHSSPYNKDAERGVNPTDPLVGINWPIKISTISKRDEDMAFISNTFKGVEIDEL